MFYIVFFFFGSVIGYWLIFKEFYVVMGEDGYERGVL